MPLNDFECMMCGHTWEEILQDLSLAQCPNCQSLSVQKMFPLTGGYQGNMGSGSTKPRQAGSFKRKERHNADSDT